MGLRPLLISDIVCIEASDVAHLSPGDSVTLLNYSPHMNMKIKSIDHDTRTITARVDTDISTSAIKYKLTWLSASIDTKTVLIDYCGMDMN